MILGGFNVRFDEKNPESNSSNFIKYNDWLFIKAIVDGKCAVCGAETNWYCFDFGNYICSEECIDKAEKDLLIRR